MRRIVMWALFLALTLGPMLACSDYDHSGMTPEQACAADATCHGAP